MHYLLRIALPATLTIAPFGHQAAAGDGSLFNYKRFSSETWENTSATSNLSDLSSANPSLSFDLDPSGVAMPAATLGIPNKYSNASKGKNGKENGEVLPDWLSQRGINNGYVSATECPTSPLAPDQIARLTKMAAQRYGVAPEFASAVVWAESRFDRVRNSPKGARGPMQLMPDTARELGVADACDPEANIDGGVRYLRALLDEFQNPLLAAAAYNAGPQAVRDHEGIPPYSETIDYLAEILNFQLGLRSPGKRPASNKSNHQPTDIGVIGGVSVGRFVAGVMKF
ncbi:lytic transglycosylase domain-containing protein [Neorhizobium sp. Rsf11]|uniref:Lytic transglycosylase domain-containing protein n=3 Tax=Neorhizobium TaxID=1525371 RepID=A0ABV0MC14_9HYPH|nr:lytic transglycosylase domain-containing protein [Neorhizobium petrolearium]MCC2614451.1 lytic transglycosylase domain-containing protein [Neorhizobium petrolearium]WGI72217.1 lytic transglycosylase domain-containing protein [Neorhizobium petrolearium]